MAGTALAIRANFNWKWSPTSAWLGESATNSLHFLFTDTEDQPSINVGPVDLNPFAVTDEGGTYQHVASSTTFDVERGWAIADRTDVDNLFNSVISAWRTYYTAVLSLMAASLEFESLRMYPIGPDGRMVSLAPMIARPTATLSPSGEDAWSPDISICCSLYSALRRKQGRGRWYLGPLEPQTLTSHGLLTQTTKDQCGNAMATFLTSLRDASTGIVAQGTLTPIVLNRTNPLVTGSVINRVRVGDELDRQERRTKGRAEAFTDYAVT
jgi:hypothetical protein